MKKTVKTVLAISAAIAAGAAIGVAFAPYKGKETRRKINDTLDQLKGKVKNSTDRIKDEALTKAEDVFELGKNNVNRMLDKVQTEAQKVAGVVCKKVGADFQRPLKKWVNLLESKKRSREQVFSAPFFVSLGM